MAGTCLVVGATGLLGGEVAKRVRTHGLHVRALVRSDSAAERVAALHSAGIETVVGDLQEPESLRRACAGVFCVVSTASAALPRRQSDTLASVDLEGQLALCAAARGAGATKFVYVSIPQNPLSFALQDAKRSVERALQRSGLTFSILQPSNFMEAWLSPMLGFDVWNAQARIFGDGTGATSWISYRDVARYLQAAIESEVLDDRTVALGGPEALSYLELVDIAKSLGAPAPELSFVDEPTLREALRSAASELDETTSALMLTAALGQAIARAPELPGLPGSLIGVKQFFSTNKEMGT